jgi:hypothetical protein
MKTILRVLLKLIKWPVRSACVIRRRAYDLLGIRNGRGVHILTVNGQPLGFTSSPPPRP